MRSPLVFLIAAAVPPIIATAEPVRFNRDIRPILSDTCFHCHGFDPKTREAGLRLDLRDEALKETENGLLPIVPGDPDKSEIILRIFDEDDPMPPEKAHKPFTPEQKDLFRRWVAEGAVYEPHWAYAPLERPALPEGREKEHPIDAFIRAKLAEKGLDLSPAAPDHVLHRRLSLDLTGLPPAAVIGKRSSVNSGDTTTATDHLLPFTDDLLSSPHFGERMAVWWLDIARYADTVGFHGDQNQRIFPYRDYVINAFNGNKPFDVFTREQLAGDLIPGATPEQLVATGYNRLNMMTREGGAQPKEYLSKYGAERVRSVAAAWFGSTFGCAECHDHKFDPISSRDFYELQSFFADMKQWGVYADYGYTPEPELKGINNDSPFPPEIEVESPWLKNRHAEAVEALANHLADSAKQLAGEEKAIAAQAKWEEGIRQILTQHPDGWIPLAPGDVAIHKEGEPVDKRKAVVDGDAVAADKALGKGETLVVTSSLPETRSLSAIRVEVPRQGRNAGKLGAALTLSLEAHDADGKIRKIGLRAGDATAKRPVHRGGAEVPGLESEWRLPKTIEDEAPLHAIWLLNAPLSLREGEKLVVSLGGDNLHPVRLAVSPLADADPLATAAPATLAALTKPLKERSDSEKSLATTAFLLATAHDRAAWDKAHQLAAAERALFDGRTWTMVTQSVEKPLDIRVLPRGNWQDETGPVVLPATPSFLPGRLESNPDKRLTRLDLANWIASDANPITARAVMNRLWALYFGTGLSAVVDDLGSQGELPSHPELLDWLAVEFRESGWDLKHMVRLIVTSETYRQSSVFQKKALEVDPANRLLASQNPRRLEAEFVRDNALAIAGLLQSDEIGGPSVKPYQPAGYYEALQFPNRDYIADTDSRQWRRGLYTHWQRTFLHPMMANFDAPARDECAAARTNSNTPQQALTLLNDPAFVEAARVFAARLLGEAAADDKARLSAAFQIALNRDPKEKEITALTAFLTNQRNHYTAAKEDAEKLLAIGLAPKAGIDPAEHAAWTQVARVLLNAQETITRY
ncbi:MAG: PSD1 domain-containing protein [Verrucomicrobiales bacterium]|nr:PSD1 domain-containing protein [Verrucomicrobiales bacterium]